MIRASSSRMLVVVCAVAVATSAQAQEAPSGLAGLLLRFFSQDNPVVLREAPVPFDHSAHFVSQPNAQETLRELNRNIALQLSTFPLASSSAGFTFNFDPELGVFERNSETFGPVFAERALTAGKGKFSAGVNHVRATYDRFEGHDLREGDIHLYLTHRDTNDDGVNTSPWFEGDIIGANLSVDLVHQTTVLYANYGVAERFDIGIAIPFEQIDLDARIVTGIEHLATSPDPFVVHAFDNGTDENVFTESGSANGIGDIVLRGKYNFLRGSTLNMAVAADLRLPTGDENDLLGSGATQAKLFVIASGTGKRFSPRASAGYSVSSRGADFIGDIPNEIGYGAGFDAFLHPRVSFSADFIGRTLLDAERVVDVDRTFMFVQRADPTVREVTHSTPAVHNGNLSLLLGSAGFKVNPVGRLLVVANVLFSLGDSGLQDKITPVFAIDYTF